MPHCGLVIKLHLDTVLWRHPQLKSRPNGPPLSLCTFSPAERRNDLEIKRRNKCVLTIKKFLTKETDFSLADESRLRQSLRLNLKELGQGSGGHKRPM
ncbi:hypothetical protein TNIN_26571 [Trichonephila inaurata madagascariensis]|uniref:Uncharacterized protein n=1 Tax=Trichonephila inaurata madagascariensis TaxID=2747483 RepID=A0A8X6YUM8_9ARAC|nr:hypothetical protein TNIN_26571 [Trichonephila inaurata madagascariensis]